ncbi:MAG: hypothetical protein IKO74_10845 [Selenomonadaceae bacterium]|nr:hypothetical protein [Selenomonadaceae bacterium]
MDNKNFEQALENYLKRNLIAEIKSLIEKRFEKECLKQFPFREFSCGDSFFNSFGAFNFDDIDFLELFGKNKSETFSEMLLRLIKESGEKNSAIYTRANIDRRHFSKIANHPDYKPSKQTALAFALALKLDFDKTQKLLAAAGYTLNKTILSDMIVSYFIEYKIFDVDLANQALYKYNQPLLGG